MSDEPTGVPERLGPFRVDGLWHADDVGVVLDARGPSGRVELVLLAAGPNHDSAARSRFATAAKKLQRDGSLILDGSTEDIPWVAVQAGSGPRGAQPLLAPIWPDVVQDDVRGPTYIPHWRGMPSSYPMRPMPLPGHHRLPWWWWLVGFLIALLIFLLIASCLPQSNPPNEGPSGSSTSTQSPSGTDSSPQSSSPGQSSSSGGSSSPGQSSSGSQSSNLSPSDSGRSSSGSAPDGTPTQPSDTSTELGPPSGSPPPEDPTVRF